MRLGLALLLDGETETACVRYAERLTRERETLVMVGATARPHVTLLHADTDADPNTLWEQACAALDPSYRLEMLALGLLRHAPTAGHMAWLIIPTTPALREAETRALALPALRGAHIATENGEYFQTHLTLAIWRGAAAPATAELAPDLIGRRDLHARLALGEIGPNGTFVRTLHRA